VNRINKRLCEEEIPANNSGQGNIAAIGVGPHGEPGMPMMKQKKRLKDVILKRKPQNI